jgi:hypothetical protein
MDNRKKNGVQMFRQSVAVALAIAVFTTSAMAGISTDKVAYRGGSVTTLKQGDERKFTLDGDAFKVLAGGHTVAIPYDKIQSIEYGQKAGRRIGAAVAMTILVTPLGLLMLASKKRKHIVTLTWQDANERNEGAVFEFGKNAIRGALAALEARSGKQIEYESEDAKKNIGR